MQGRFQVINDSLKRLKFAKSKLLEDIDQLIKQQIFELTNENALELEDLATV